jgi:hypothetical protein
MTSPNKWSFKVNVTAKKGIIGIVIASIGTIYAYNKYRNNCLNRIKNNPAIIIDTFQNKLSNMSDQTLLHHHNNAVQITGSNAGSTDVTQCGTTANAMMDIIPLLYGIKLKNSLLDYITFSSSNVHLSLSIDNIIDKIKQDTKDTPIVYNVAVNMCTLSSSNIFYSSQIMFPGHAFILWKIDKDRYIFIQSYVGKYKTKIVGVLDQDKCIQLLTKFKFIVTHNDFSGTSNKYWKEITEVSESRCVGYSNPAGFEFSCQYIEL